VSAVDLSESWSLFVRYQYPRLAAKTRSEYATAWRRISAELPVTPTVEDVLRWHRVVLPGAGLSLSYCNWLLSILQSVSRRSAAVSGDYELAVVVERVRAYRLGAKTPRCPPRDLLERVMPVARNKAESAWLLLACRAGLRRGELLGLRGGDFDPDTRVLQVVRQRHSSHRKNHRPHAVELDDETAKAVEWTILHYADIRPRTGYHRGVSDGFLFPWGLRYVDNFLGRLRAFLGPDSNKYFPPGTGWHGCRHWGASELARSGATLTELQAWLGDADPKVCLSYLDQVRGRTKTQLVGVAGRSDDPRCEGSTSTPHPPLPAQVTTTKRKQRSKPQKRAALGVRPESCSQLSFGFARATHTLPGASLHYDDDPQKGKTS